MRSERFYRAVTVLTVGLAACASPEDEATWLEEPTAEAPTTDTPATDTSEEALLYDVMGSNAQNGFDPQRKTHDWFCIGNETCATGDFDGDGQADLVTFVPANGRVYVAITAPGGLRFESTRVWSWSFARRGRDFAVGDVNGDGRDDLVGFEKDTGRVRVALSTGAGFGADRLFLSNFCRGAEVCKVADTDGDGRDDVLRFVKSTAGGGANGDVWVALSGGNVFRNATRWNDWFCIGNETCDVGDFNRDGRADVVTFVNGAGYPSGGAWIAYSDGRSFTGGHRPLNHLCAPGYHCTAGDVDGNGLDDLVVFANGTGVAYSGYDFRDDVNVALRYVSLQAPFFHQEQPQIRAERFCPAGHVCDLADMNGDGKEDMVAFARDALGGGGRGDVFVALSNFGDDRRWTLDLDTITAQATEGNDDKPLVLALFFRATFGQRGSTEIVRNAYNEEFARGIRVGGAPIRIPSNVGEHTFRGVKLSTRHELMQTDPFEVLGAVVVVLEKDLTAAAAYDGLMAEGERALRVVLEEVVEGVRPIDLANPDAISDAMEVAEQRVRDEVLFGAIDDLLHWFISAPWDPDDLLDAHVVFMPTLDKSARDLLPRNPDPAHITMAIPGEDYLGYYPKRLYFSTGDRGIRYAIDARTRGAVE